MGIIQHLLNNVIFLTFIKNVLTHDNRNMM